MKRFSRTMESHIIDRQSFLGFFCSNSMIKMVDEFPSFNIEGIKVPRVLIGINPFLGGSHFSKARSKYFRRIFGKVSAISDIIVKATEFGVTGIFTPASQKISKTLIETEERTGIDMTVVGTTCYTFNISKMANELDLLSDMGAKICLLHGNMVDDLLDPPNRSIKGAEEMLQLIRDKDMIPGIACHDARAMLFAKEKGYDSKIYATPVNKIGFWMSQEGLTLKIIKGIDEPLIALKPFASGRMQPEEGLEFTLSTPGVTAVAIGVSNYEEVIQDFTLAKELLHGRHL